MPRPLLRIRPDLKVATAIVVLVLTAGVLGWQASPVSNAVRAFLHSESPLIAIEHVNVIDGTGAPARQDQTIVINDGLIAALGPAATTVVPEGAARLDGKGKSVFPGLVMVHEHLYYPAGSGVYGTYGVSFSRLYLAGGVTTMRTGGNVDGFIDLNLKQRSDRFDIAAPVIDATAPYLNGPNTFLQMYSLKDADDARRHVAYWAEAGATSFKAYMQITRAELAAAIEEAHKRGLKITGHLCSVTYAEAAAMGIDNLEHGFAAATDFVANKQPDVCPGQGQGQATITSLDPESDQFKSLVRTLVERKVALTSTLTVFETFTPRRPPPPGLQVLAPHMRDDMTQRFERMATQPENNYTRLFPKLMQLEYAFAKAGGLLIAGTDPTGSGGVVPGFSNQRQLELLVEAGFTPVEAIQIGTLNGARYLGRDARIGSLVVGKQADLVLVSGDPATTIGDVRRVETVFRQGRAFDAAKLIQSVTGRVGIW